MKETKFYQEMKMATLEREVELVYKKGVNYYYPDVPITNPFGSDGHIDTSIDGKKLNLLMELKFDEDLKKKTSQCKVIIQALYYIKKFEEDGRVLPNVIMIGDKDEVFVMHNNSIVKYLDEDIDWSIAPSSAGVKNVELVMKMVEDDSISPFVFEIKQDFVFKNVIDKINDLAKNIQRFVRVTEHNISTIYDYFISRVIKEPSKIDPNDLVSIFISLMINENDYYLHPKKKDILVLNDKRELKVNSGSYNSFFSYFERNYSPKEKVKFTEIADRLIEDTNRRNKGEFYTPTTWVDKGHRIIEKQFGHNWKEEYIVWDCASGTCNLTRDYNFKELYLSTINETDFAMATRYNRNAVKFEYDFLNDDVEMFTEDLDIVELEYKMPKGLFEALKENKKIIILINPPYATAGNARSESVESKDGVADNKMNALMKSRKAGKSSQQLYAQFLYRILMFKKKFNLTNINIAIYSPSLFLSGTSFKEFRKEFLSEFHFAEGMLFKADNFADVKASWAVDFSIWKSGEIKNKESFTHVVADLNDKGEVVSKGNKVLYNLDKGKTLSTWIKDKKPEKTIKLPAMKSAMNMSEKIYEVDKDYLGFLVNDANNVYASVKGVYLMNGKVTRHLKTNTITDDNFEKCCVLFTARNSIKSNWVNQKDEFMQPNESHESYEEFVGDSIVYSIFSNANNICSFRELELDGKLFNMKNNFFFMSKAEMSDLAERYKNDDVYTDVLNEREEAHVYKALRFSNLSSEAKEVLELGRDLVRKSFKYRSIVHYDQPELQVNNWDASWYQVKQVTKKYLEEDMKVFDEKFSTLETKITKNVYELNFLK